MNATSSSESTQSPALQLPPGYTLRAGYPPVPVYINLRAAAGLYPKTPSQAEPIARNSWHGCYITFTPPTNTATTTTTTTTTTQTDEQQEIVAMGRIIGDGGWYFHIADMAVLPDHQRKGLGGVVLRHLLAHIKERAPRDGTGAYVTLFADAPGRRLYARNGFVETMPLGQMGMMMPMGWEGWEG